MATKDEIEKVQDLRTRVLAGEDVSDDELAEGLELLAKRRAEIANRKAAKRKPINLEDSGDE